MGVRDLKSVKREYKDEEGTSDKNGKITMVGSKARVAQRVEDPG